MTEQPQPPVEAAFFTSIRKWGIVRGANGVAGGVVEGIGERIGLARVPGRLLTVLLWLLLPGIVMVAYAAGWGLLPDQRGNIVIQNFGRGVTNVGALIGIAILGFIGTLAFDDGLFFSWLGIGNSLMWDGFPFHLAVLLIPVMLFFGFVGAVVLLIIWFTKRSHGNTADAPVTPASNGTSATGGSPAHDAAQPGSSSPSTSQPATAQPNGAQHMSNENHSAEPSSSGTPQPWEPALLPGDPRAGVRASAGATKRHTNGAHHTGAAHTATAQGGSASASAPPPPPPTPPARQARPPAPSVPGPGKGAYLAFGAVLLISAAIAVGLERTDMLSVSPLIAWGAAITVGLGAILVIVALAGRKLGFLGFLSVFAVLLALLFAANAQEIVSNYQNDRDWWYGTHDGPEIVPEEPADDDHEVAEETMDLTADLANHYSSVFIAGACMTPANDQPWSDVIHYGDSIANMRLDAVEDDIDLDLTATYTRLAIPEGTSIEVLGSGQTTVVWEDRDALCSTWFDGHEYETDEYGDPAYPTPQTMLSMTNAEAPVITINAGMDKSIYLEEVAQ